MTTRKDLYQSSFTLDGKRYYVYGHSKAEAKQKAKIKKALLSAGVRETKGDQLVSKWSKTWLTTYKDGVVSERWYDAMESIINNSIDPIIGDKQIKNVKPIDIVKVLNNVSDRSESYVKKTLLILKQIFESAEDNDLILKNPVKRAKIPLCKEQNERRTITEYERELTIRTARKHPQDGLFFLIMLYCGLRPQEVAVLTYDDFDFDNHILKVTKALKSDDTIGKPKSRAGTRDIPLPSALADMIPQTNGYICTNLHGQRLTNTSIRNLWNRFKREMELEHGTKTSRNKLVDPYLPDDLTPYCYRHTYCTDLQDKGVPLVVASRLMGHSDIKMTAKVYTHASKDSFQDAYERIEGTTQTTTFKEPKHPNQE